MRENQGMVVMTQEVEHLIMVSDAMGSKPTTLEPALFQNLRRLSQASWGEQHSNWCSQLEYFLEQYRKKLPFESSCGSQEVSQMGAFFT